MFHGDLQDRTAILGEMKMDIMTWTFTAVCLAGTVLNVKKKIGCFYLWTAGNIAWLAFDIWQGLYSRASLDAVQMAFAIWGIFEWSNKKQGDKDNG